MSPQLRKLLRALHRDIGYFIAALVCAYSVSGVAVNHIDAWNPSYAIEQRAITMQPLVGDLTAMQEQVVQSLALDRADVTGHRLLSQHAFVLFLREGGEVRLDPTTGRGRLKLVQPRPLLRSFNVLHLNHIKGAWTWFADAFAVMLVTLALTGLVMLKGKLGLSGRGKWFAAAGLAAPIAFLAAHYAS